MKRKSVITPKPTQALRLDPGIVLCAPCLVTDKWGKSWWVNPIERSIVPIDG